MINKSNAKHYTWGNDCDSWVFLDNDKLSIKLESMPIGTKEKLHFHSNAQQFFFILKGTATLYIDKNKKLIQENQGISIDANTKHYIANTSEKMLSFLVISQPSTNNDRVNIDN